jgi:hypothetical protein
MTSGAVEELWKNVAENRSDDSGALVVPFNPSLGGVSYVLKFINQADGGWDFRNLHLFTSTSPPGTLNSRQRRHLRRHILRTHLFTTAKLTTGGDLMIPPTIAHDCKTSMVAESHIVVKGASAIQ